MPQLESLSGRRPTSPGTRSRIELATSSCDGRYCRHRCFRLGSRSFRLFELLQHVSTVLGSAILIFAYIHWSRRVDVDRHAQRNADDRWRYRLLAMIAITSLVVGVPAAYFASTSSLSGTNVSLFLVRCAICCTTVFLLLLCAASLVVARRARARDNLAI